MICTLPADVGAVQSNRTRWMKHVVCMGRCEVPSVFDRKPQMMRPLARTRRRRVPIKHYRNGLGVLTDRCRTGWSVVTFVCVW
jgi:hypothetical protein